MEDLSVSDVEVIRGGWSKVPSNLYCKTDLMKKGLIPKNKNKPAAIVWNSYNWINLYDISDCRKKRKPTPNQLAALRKGREKLKKMVTCSECGENVHFTRNMVGDLCIECNDRESSKKYYDSIMEHGKNQFKKWFNEKFIILDTETTGLYDGEIIELSIIDREGNVLFDSLFKPKFPIPDEVIEIHGITNEMVADAPTWIEKWSEVKNLIENNKTIIYNAKFDLSMITNTSRIWGIERDLEDEIKINASCAMEAYKDYIASERWVKLSVASGEYTSHRALDDCYSVLKLLNNVWSELGLNLDETAATKEE